MNAKVNWKPVSISGVTGVLMGAGTVYATQHSLISGAGAANTSARLREVTADDSQSFKQAFDAARDEVGPGGVFHWRGNIYNTYTSDEWDTMSIEEKDQFAQQVNPEVSPADIDTTQLEESVHEDVADLTDESVEEVKEETEDFAQNITEQPDSDVNIVSDDSDVAMAVVSDEEQVEELPGDDGDDDVRIIGTGEVTLANGNSVIVQELEMNGNRVAVIDVDKDGIGDIAMCDANHNNQADDGEIIDLHTGEALSFNNQTSTEDADFDLGMMNI